MEPMSIEILPYENQALPGDYYWRFLERPDDPIPLGWTRSLTTSACYRRVLTVDEPAYPPPDLVVRRAGTDL